MNKPEIMQLAVSSSIKTIIDAYNNSIENKDLSVEDINIICDFIKYHMLLSFGYRRHFPLNLEQFINKYKLNENTYASEIYKKHSPIVEFACVPPGDTFILKVNYMNLPRFIYLYSLLKERNPNVHVITEGDIERIVYNNTCYAKYMKDLKKAEIYDFSISNGEYTLKDLVGELFLTRRFFNYTSIVSSNPGATYDECIEAANEIKELFNILPKFMICANKNRGHNEADELGEIN